MFNPPDPALVQAFIGYLLAAIPGLLAGLFVLQLRRCWESRLWPSTCALILTSKVIEVGKSENDYGHAFTYAYRVAGCDYTGTRIDVVGTYTLTARRAARLARKYRPNTRAAVYYNPAKPGQSVLAPGFTWTLAYPVIAMIALALMAWRALK